MIRIVLLSLLTLSLSYAQATCRHEEQTATVMASPEQPVAQTFEQEPTHGVAPEGEEQPEPESSFSSANPFSPELLETPRKNKRDTPFLPTRRRIDREINKIKYVQKGEIMMGLTASYGTLNSDDAEMWLVLDNINLDASIFTINPFLGYFFRDNMCLGARFGYSQINGNLASAAINLGEANDINLAVNDIKLANENISFGIFLRSYAGLDAKGHFGLFGELELTMSSGSSEFSYMSGGDPHQTFGDNTKLKLSFNPGMAVYIFPNVCSTISFGLGGIQYTKTTQKDAEGNKTGSRTSSNMRFRLNLAEIRIGLTVHLWNKKKSL